MERDHEGFASILLAFRWRIRDCDISRVWDMYLHQLSFSSHQTEYYIVRLCYGLVLQHTELTLALHFAFKNSCREVKSKYS